VLLRVRGRLGLVRAGGAYALWCLACCGPLMVALVVAGLMGPWWIALVGAYLVLERASSGARIPVAVGLCLAVLGVLVATVPALAPTTHLMNDTTMKAMGM
jgi:predicted metal-binding membrane protein